VFSNHRPALRVAIRSIQWSREPSFKARAANLTVSGVEGVSVRNIDSKPGLMAHEGFNRAPLWILMLRIANFSLSFSVAC
jgi:hypothetical protein